MTHPGIRLGMAGSKPRGVTGCSTSKSQGSRVLTVVRSIAKLRMRLSSNARRHYVDAAMPRKTCGTHRFFVGCCQVLPIALWNPRSKSAGTSYSKKVNRVLYRRTGSKAPSAAVAAPLAEVAIEPALMLLAAAVASPPGLCRSRSTRAQATNPCLLRLLHSLWQCCALRSERKKQPCEIQRQVNC